MACGDAPLRLRDVRLIATAQLLFGTGLMLNAAATVPTYRVKPTCRAAIQMSGMAGRTVEICEASEAQARAEIVKAGSTFTDSAKDRCIRTSAGHARSDIELLSCLESVCDQKRQEQENASARLRNLARRPAELETGEGGK